MNKFQFILEQKEPFLKQEPTEEFCGNCCYLYSKENEQKEKNLNYFCNFYKINLSHRNLQGINFHPEIVRYKNCTNIIENERTFEFLLKKYLIFRDANTLDWKTFYKYNQYNLYVERVELDSNEHIKTFELNTPTIEDLKKFCSSPCDHSIKKSKLVFDIHGFAGYSDRYCGICKKYIDIV